ncbi:mitochondrial peroxiredoxin PRX1 [Durotheca rogersii]|uniref:mitochondrial peroxiredoxin PRX1 n=1 Tax=Durotheca rogersii TaxID=419775 RepID=UPI002220065F|nr:mitochondrial peroxiredoxin PRX1 [Durotheca rogersii]KAI5860172.1 mitochondrial peroxiredoxin PRX1 [Durotheca rogersii]
MAALFARSAARATTLAPRLALPKMAASPVITMKWSVVPVAATVRTAQQPLSRRLLATSALPEQPRLRLGSEAPNFQAKTTQGDIDFHTWLDKSWAILFSHPADFTPVCTTELGAFARLAPEFARRGVKMIGLSADDVGSHERWVGDIDEVAGARVSFPIIADADRRVAYLYDMVDAQGVANADAGRGPAPTIRSVFVIDPARKIRLTMAYPASTGRNAAEVLRVVDSLQTVDRSGVATPINWTPGDDVIVPPSVSTEDARKKFKDVREVKPYLRFAKV